jgi:D-proline reductase (dithiol) PrdB
MRIRRFIHQATARLAARWPALANRLVASFEPRQSSQIPWTPVKKPLDALKIALVTTAGVHHRHQPAFNMTDKNGDPTFRVLDGRTIESDYLITHDYYDHRDADRDVNVVFPLTRLRELLAAECIGGITRCHIGFMGHIDGPHIDTLIRDTAPRAAEQLKAEGAEAVFLTPA